MVWLVAGEPYVLDGQVYPDETTAMVANHPHIPDDIKRIYITGTEDSKGPLGTSTEAAGALKTQEGTQVAPAQNTSPEPSYNTPLNPAEQAVYNTRFSAQDSKDYDMQGWFKANPTTLPNAEGVHYPDTFKKPNHPTFSDQSMYHGEANRGGSWTVENGQDVFTPSDLNLKNMPREDMQAYFDKVEKGVKLNLPDVHPEPYGLNPPEQGPGFADPNKPEAKVLFKTPSGVEITDQDIDKAINVTMGVGAGTIGGVRGGKAKLADLGHAQVLEASGTHPDVIHAQTGFWRGAEGRWRHEIDDSTSSFDRNWHDKQPAPKKKYGLWEQEPFNPNEGMVTSKLSEVLDHPELYKNYPSLKDITVIKDPGYSSTGAQWEVGSGPTKHHLGQIRMGSEAASSHGILMHEVQHAIQDFEGFSKGGSPGKAGTNYQLKLREDMLPVAKRLQSLYDKHQSVYPTGLNAAEKAEMEHLSFLANKYNEYAKAGDKQALEYYFRLAGEVEARNVDARLLLTESERRQMHPKWTEDVRSELQIPTEEAVSTTAYGVRDPKTGKSIKPPRSEAVGAAAALGIQQNFLGDIYDKITGKTSVTEISGDKSTDYPNEQDAKNAIQQGFGYGTGSEPYIDAKVARIKTEGLIRDLGKMIDSKASNVDLTKLSNIDERAKIGTLYAQGALAVNRSAIATLGFKPDNTELSTGLGRLTTAGATDNETGKMWVNVAEGRRPSTIVHESIHNGLDVLRKRSPEAKEIMKKLPNEEYVVRYMMAKKMGNPEEGNGDLADKQIKTALSLFGLDDRYGKYVDQLEEIAAEVHKNQRPRGPR